MVVTAPVPDRLEEIGWTGGENVRDLRSVGPLPADDGRRTDRDGARRPATGPGAPHRSRATRTTRRRSAGWPTICSGCSPSSPASRIDAGLGRPDQRERARDAVLRHARAGQRALRAGLHRQRRGALATWVARSARRSPPTPTTGSRGWPSSPASRSGSRRSRCAPRACTRSTPPSAARTIARRRAGCPTWQREPSPPCRVDSASISAPDREPAMTMSLIPPDLGRSWWLREALALPEFAGEPCPPLVGDTTADVVILGGGYTGMWTRVVPRGSCDPGVDVVLLEQDICGGGPSGRNGGFVNSFWGDLTTLCERFGDDAALAAVPRRRGERHGDRRVLRGPGVRRLVPRRRRPRDGLQRLAGRRVGRRGHHRRSSGPGSPRRC